MTYQETHKSMSKPQTVSSVKPNDKPGTKVNILHNSPSDPYCDKKAVRIQLTLYITKTIIKSKSEDFLAGKKAMHRVRAIQTQAKVKRLFP